MPPRRAECGTYGAYRRHLKHDEPIDDACRAAQREHDGSRSTSAAARAKRAAGGQVAPDPPEEPLSAAPLTEEGYISRVEVLKEMLQDSRELVKVLRRTDPQRAYLQQREQREILRELSELQGNGQAKGVTLADQLAEARTRRLAASQAS